MQQASGNLYSLRDKFSGVDSNNRRTLFTENENERLAEAVMKVLATADEGVFKKMRR